MTYHDPRRSLAPITCAQRHHLNAWARLVQRLSADEIPADDAACHTLYGHALAAHAAAMATTHAHPVLAQSGHTDCRWYAEQLAAGWRVGDR